MDFATRTVEVVNQPPNPPYNPSPAHGASGVPITTDQLTWEVSDPDSGSSLTGTSKNFPIIRGRSNTYSC